MDGCMYFTPSSPISTAGYYAKDESFVDSSSPRSDSNEKLTSVCRNCGFTYRISWKTKNMDGFCCKDCFTCATMFAGFPKFTPPVAAKQVKQDIYQFQEMLVKGEVPKKDQDDTKVAPAAKSTEKGAPSIVKPKKVYGWLY